MSAVRSLAHQPGHPQVRLTLRARQLECLSWVQEGKSSSDIGQILGLSPRTVERHIAIACDHLGVRTRIQAVLKARNLGLLFDRPDRPGPIPGE